MSCPICSKAAAERYRPFCSKRCADIDLGKWLTGSYVIPNDESAEIDDPEQVAFEKVEKPH